MVARVDGTRQRDSRRRPVFGTRATDSRVLPRRHSNWTAAAVVLGSSLAAQSTWADASRHVVADPWAVEMAYDTVRQRLVATISRTPNPSYSGLLETWEHTAGWTRALPAAGPPDGVGSAMAFDEQRGRTVRFGGITGSWISHDEHWEYDGLQWVSRGGTRPPARRGHCMVFDSGRGVIVLHGGEDSATRQAHSDTWEFDGSAWTRASAVASPSVDAAMAYDPLRRRVVRYGGWQSGLSMARTLEWDGSVWRRGPDGPGARHGSRLAFDAARGVMVMFGGTDGTRVFDDTWLYDGVSWRQASPSAPMGALHSGAMAYDAGRGRVQYYGGLTAARRPATGLWEWDGSDWVARTVPVLPGGGVGVATCYDALRGRVVLHGAAGTHEWDGYRWHRSVAASAPSSAGNPAMAFDHTTGRSVLFTAHEPGNPTWWYDGARWWPAAAAVSPPVRDAAALAFDAARGDIVLFGGRVPGSSTLMADTWLFDGSTWRAHAGSGPLGAWGNAMVYDPGRQRVVLVTGRSSALGTDTWEWDGTQWSLRAVGAALQWSDPSLAYDPRIGRVVSWVGAAGAGGALWQWDGTSWTAVSIQEGPGAGTGQRLEFDARSNRLLLYEGGRDKTWVHDDAGRVALELAYGTSCPPAGGLVMRALGPASVFAPGFVLDLHGVPPGGAATIGLSGGPAQLQLAGCTLFLDPSRWLAALPLAPRANGFAAVSVPTPPAALGVELFGQAFALDASALRLLGSRALRLRIGL